MHLILLEAPVLPPMMLGGGRGWGMWDPNPIPALFTPVPFACAPSPGGTLAMGEMLPAPSPPW